MSSGRASSGFMMLLAMTVAVILISHIGGVGATRVLPEDFGHSNHLETYSSAAYDRARHAMAYWLQRLSSGPSPSGPGH
ncbi:hypothetical protein FNV43_RR07115 [Rhamnella rubrinervis]|uniref:Uncharacterized protein n=1 Tax=Rhamnella rubrinervis TaxID=2594499 RepID=A0A8K0MLW7_9ROSA|nr:hypothetical protein FNV43_RR07115 [Rhamnella rubrinervis]